MAIYDHQPYENWLFSAEILTDEQSKELHEHLLTCEHCRCLAAGWQDVELELKAAPAVAPAPGFASRWQVRLNAGRARRAQRQAVYFLVFSIGGAVLLLVALGILVWPVFQSPYPFLLAVASRITFAYTVSNTITSVLETLSKATLEVIPPMLWLALIVVLGSLSVVWVFALRKLAYVRRIL